MNIFSIFFNMKVCYVFSLESPHQGNSNEHKQLHHFQYKKEKRPKLSQIYSYGIFFLRV